NGVARSFVQQLGRERKALAWDYERAQLRLFQRSEERHPGELSDGDDQPARGLRHRLDEQHARHQWIAGKVAFEDGGCARNARLGSDGLLGKIEIDDTVDELKVLEAHASASGALGSDKFVDAGAKVVQLKILFGSRFAVVDLLRPLLQGHFDSERLVDRECNVEEVEAVDAEVVDGVAFRLDRVTRN